MANDTKPKKPVAKQPTVVDLVDENKRLSEENYNTQRDNSVRLIVMLSISVVINLFLIWLAFFHFPQTQTAWTSNAAAVCNVTPISKPRFHQQVVANFAAEAAIGIYSYDYLNYRRSVTAVSEKYFTPDFRDQFMRIFGDSTNLKLVRDNYYIVSAIVPNAPQIEKTGQKGGAYFWTIQVPLKVFYSSGRKSQDDKVLATVTVVQVDPSRFNPSGLAVDNIVTAQMIQ